MREYTDFWGRTQRIEYLEEDQEETSMTKRRRLRSNNNTDNPND